MQQVFALANRLHIPIVVHLRSRSGTSYGAPEARLFMEQLLPMVPDVSVQIAHLAGAGPGHSDDADEALAVFVAAISNHDVRVKRLIFDVTTVASADASSQDGALIAHRIRQIGVERILFGSDLPIGANPALAQSWQLFVSKVPLTTREFARIAANIGPY
jgi:predicted TIM-barrel fold metal-dependent hydrolase